MNSIQTCLNWLKVKTNSNVSQTDPNRFKQLSHRKTIGSCYAAITCTPPPESIHHLHHSHRPTLTIECYLLNINWILNIGFSTLHLSICCSSSEVSFLTKPFEILMLNFSKSLF